MRTSINFFRGGRCASDRLDFWSASISAARTALSVAGGLLLVVPLLARPRSIGAPFDGRQQDPRLRGCFRFAAGLPQPDEGRRRPGPGSPSRGRVSLIFQVPTGSRRTFSESFERVLRDSRTLQNVILRCVQRGSLDHMYVLDHTTTRLISGRAAHPAPAATVYSLSHAQARTPLSTTCRRTVNSRARHVQPTVSARDNARTWTEMASSPRPIDDAPTRRGRSCPRTES